MRDRPPQPFLWLKWHRRWYWWLPWLGPGLWRFADEWIERWHRTRGR